MDIIKLPILDLLVDPSNLRIHDQKNLDAIKGSLAKFGQQKPIVISKEKVIIAGNGTFESAKALGWTEIDCVISVLGKTEQIAFALADNRTSELSVWDDTALGLTLHALREENFDLTLIGFDTSYLDNLSREEFNFRDPGADDKNEIPPKKFSIIVNFDDNDSRQQLFLELRDRGFRVRI